MNSSKLRFLIVVTALAGLVGLTLANSEFAAHLPFEALLGVTLSLALVWVAFADYARRPKTLAVPAEIVRPVPRKTVRVAACIERVAA
jgi:hypothetical protein